MKRIKVGDTVIVVSGNDKNKQGKVLRLFNKEETAIVENVRILKKAVRANPNQGISGGIVSKEFPIALSNLMLYNPLLQKKDKLSIKILENNKRVRHFRSNDEPVDMQTRGES